MRVASAARSPWPQSKLPQAEILPGLPGFRKSHGAISAPARDVHALPAPKARDMSLAVQGRGSPVTPEVSPYSVRQDDVAMNGVLHRPAAFLLTCWRLAAAAAMVIALTTAASGQYWTPDQCDECDLNNCHLPCCHDVPELWLVNTRCAPKCSNLDAGFEEISVKTPRASGGSRSRGTR